MTQPQLPIPEPVASREQAKRHISNMLVILKGENHANRTASNDPQPSEPRQKVG